jgi:hypothetical protein
MSWTAVAILGGIGVAIVLILFVAKRPMRSKSDHSRDHTYLFFSNPDPGTNDTGHHHHSGDFGGHHHGGFGDFGGHHHGGFGDFGGHHGSF